MILPEAGLALVIEALVGYPQRLVQAIGHPVIWIGKLIASLDRRLNRPDRQARTRRAAGVLAVCILLGVSLAAAALVRALVLHLPFGRVLVALAASTLLAQRSLYQHVAQVGAALGTRGLAAGRIAVSHIVGRDPEVLDEHGVCRAAIESLAENFSDGVVAPAFWLAVAGLPGIAAYKAINTADSMIGHRTPRHEAFGWAAARLDDLINIPASRLSALLLVAAAAFLPGANGRGAWRAVRRDARHHRSPNAGWPEAAMAGALGLALAGPRSYGGKVVADAFMGDGRRDATPADIGRALRLFLLADAMLVGAILAAGLW
ncbi:MAG TPA: adenosylcobinamide-phosphate synthase CbiB [Rhodopila sp.]|nr:adenosylcobinamide-phosphate synthase CbiB [Rhodopila sp.]